jgi:hypothetical protein
MKTKLNCDFALRLPTFAAPAEMTGISRVLGGYYIQADNIEGLKLSRDRLMNWVVGALLTLGIAIVVILQVHPPV